MFLLVRMHRSRCCGVRDATTTSGPTHRCIIDRRPGGPCNGRLRNPDQLRQTPGIEAEAGDAVTYNLDHLMGSGHEIWRAVRRKRMNVTKTDGQTRVNTEQTLSLFFWR